jgi:putative permease
MNAMNTTWFSQLYRQYSTAEYRVFFSVMLIIVAVLSLWTDVLMPVLVALTLAYLLEKPVQWLVRLRLQRSIAVSLMLTLLILALVLVTLALLPVITQQSQTLVSESPQILSRARHYLQGLPQMIPGVITESQIQNFILKIESSMLVMADAVIATSWSGVTGLARILVFFILVPMMVLFMLNDKQFLLKQITEILPAERRILRQWWQELNGQIMGYIRGKLLELFLVGAATYVLFVFFDLQYALLLALLVGCSVLIPYIGIFVVTVPVVLVAFSQFGATPATGYLLLAYAIIQAIDAYILVPLLFAEVVDLHPLYIIIAVLFFGGVLGFWGIFFAIPLASMVKATYHALQGPKPPAENPS